MKRLEREDGLAIVVGIENGIFASVYGLEDTLGEESEAAVPETPMMDSVLL